MNINKVFLFGNLTRDPELKALPSGTKVASFGLATNRTWKDANGAKQEEVTFHNIIAFGKTAEILTQYVQKGKGLFVEGRINNRSWDDKDGKKMYRTEIVVDNFQFGPDANGGANASKTGVGEAKGADEGKYGAPGSKTATVAKSWQKDEVKVEPKPMFEYPTEDINPDDIPF